MNTLEDFGWNNFYQELYRKNPKTDFEAGRVISIKGFKYFLVTHKGEIESELSGKMLYATENDALPKVGDWVTFIRYDTIGYIIEVLPRMNELYRKSPGTKTEKQVIAANIDYAFIVQGLDRDFNIMRLERYLTQILACNVDPVIVLNKSDLVEDACMYRDEVMKLGRNCPVYICSTLNQTGLSELRRILEKNKTYILIGSSGVGKSSLINYFMEGTGRKTASISESTGKGRHQTTTRDLFRLPNGSLIIDTPGMREFGVGFEEGLFRESLFPLIDDLSGSCRYPDCTHLKEPGCAVLEAYRNGSLNPQVYESYLKLIKENKHFETSLEEKKRMGKRFGKLIREVREYRKKYKY